MRLLAEYVSGVEAGVAGRGFPSERASRPLPRHAPLQPSSPFGVVFRYIFEHGAYSAPRDDLVDGRERVIGLIRPMGRRTASSCKIGSSS